MKQKILLLIILAAIIGFIYPLNIEKALIPPSGNEEFILGAMSNTSDVNYSHTANPLEFGMNLWHQYTGSEKDPNIDRYYPTGWTPQDKLFADYNVYSQGVMDKLSENSTHGMKSLMQRPKIEWLCFGQRSDYQCEEEQNVDPFYWFYSFQRHKTGEDIQDATQYGSGQWVRHCRAGTDAADTVAARLKANNEQCTHGNVQTFDHWDDSRCTWYVKPSIRIDKDFANTIANENVKVCRVDVYNFDGFIESNPNQNKIKSFDVRVRNFKESRSVTYDGNYLEKFHFITQDWQDTSTQNIDGAWNPGTGNDVARGRIASDDSQWTMSRADIRVYWYGNCEMWIDYVRVDNDVADQLFKNYYDDPNHPERQWILWESQIANSSPSAYKFYIEEFEFNNIPCIAYVNQKLKQYTTPDVDMMACFYWKGIFNHMNGWGYQRTGNWTDTRKFDAEILHHVFGEPAGITTLFTETYPFAANYKPSDVQVSMIPSGLNNTSGACVLGTTNGPAPYDDWLQTQLDYPDYPLQPPSPPPPAPPTYNDAGWQGWTLKLANEYGRTYGVPFINMPQTHLWANWNVEVRREPTNEEIKLQTNLALSYGAKGLIYFWYGGNLTSCGTGNNFDKGYLDDDHSPNVPRLQNAYGQPKWDSLIATHQQVKNWAQYFYSFNPHYTHSYVYHQEYSTVNSSTIFSDIQTLYPDITDDVLESLPNRYIQAATFDNLDEQNTKYFMLVNRRCAPYRPDINDNGGRRHVKVIFNPSQLQYFTNWKIINLENNSTLTTFSKSQSPLIDLGWYMPGEGRLYKLVPVMVDGGTLFDDENLDLIPSFNCYGVVHNGGHNITIQPGNYIHFVYNGHIVMNGGNFTSGFSNNQDYLTLSAEGNSPSPILSFTDCGQVKLYSTHIISDYGNSYLAASTNSRITVVWNCNFTSSENQGGFQYLFTSASVPKGFNLYAGENAFNMNSAGLPALCVMASGGAKIPFNADHNNFYSSGTSSEAIHLVNVSGGVIQNNTITGYSYGINALSSNLALYRNNITSSVNGSYGISSESGAVLDMRQIAGYSLGANTISNTGANSYNMNVDNSYFLMNTGYNIFNFTGSSNNYHLYGTFPTGVDDIDLNNTNNCFKINGVEGQTPVKSVNWNGGGEVEFLFIPYSCGTSGQEDLLVMSLGDNLYDTITLKNGYALNAYDSIGLEMRKRNYENVINEAKTILNNSPDSIQSIDAVSKLFTAVTVSDTSEASKIELKNYLLVLILNNPDNTGLVTACNYHVQKCKVMLKQYASAMAGFQDIINQNPYSYEALVAHWDYMAAHLLDSLSAGGMSGDGYDDRTGDTKFTKEEKQFIKQNIKTAGEKIRYDEEKKIELLTKQASEGNENAKVKLEQKRTLNEVVRVKTPKNTVEYIQIVNDDIKKLFIKKNEAGKTNNIIPNQFALSQNYPNPFNPETTIKYALPRDVKVVIKIYDILGREVSTLVNEFKKAGYYEVKFNGSNFASGVYFYRIEAQEYVVSKKMVLIK